VPPHNLQAEESLLGAVLLSREAIATAAEGSLRPDDFYKPAHGHIYAAVQALYSGGEPVDPVTVADELRRADLLDAAGGPGVLVDLQLATPAVSSAGHYARIITEHALLRKLITVAGEIAEIGYGLPDDVDKAIDRAESMVFEINQRRVVDSEAKLNELLRDALDELEKLFERGSRVTGVATGYTDLDHLLSGLQPSTLNVVGARPSMGKCVAWDTPILDPATGELVTAAELFRRGRAGEWVQVAALDRNGRVQVVSPSAFVDDGVKPVYRVTTRLGRVVRTTASHPFLTPTGWQPLRDLAVGARVATPRRLPYFGSERLPGGEIVVLAHVLGDAGLDAHPERVRDQVISRGPTIGVDAVRVLRTHRLWTVDPSTVTLPPAIERLPAPQLRVFLDRLMAANRCARHAVGGAATFVACSEPLARQVQHLLLRFGKVTSLRSCSKRGLPLHIVEELTPAETHGARHAPGGDPSVPAVTGGGGQAAVGVLASRLVVGPDVLWDEIVEVAADGEDQVYDLTVPDLHNFVAADVFVHNTAFALGMASAVAVQGNHPVLFFSLEMGHRELTQRILSAEARVDSSKLRTGDLAEADWRKIVNALGTLEPAPLYIDDNPNVTVMEIRAKARRLKSRIGELGLIVIDYLQLMTGRNSAESRQIEISEISRGLKILARELEVPVVALSQLNRSLEQRADKRPMLSDLRESGSIEQDSDVVMFIYRDEVYNPESPDAGIAEILVAKHRNGPIGIRKLAFLPTYTRFANMARTDM